MIYIRQTNPSGVRPGQWAHLFSIQHTSQCKDIWIVEFPDGHTDAWTSWDTDPRYEVRVQIERPFDEEPEVSDRMRLLKSLEALDSGSDHRYQKNPQ